MGGPHDQGAVTDHIAYGTVDLDLVLGKVGNLTVFLCVAGVAEEHDTLDLLFHVVW